MQILYKALGRIILQKPLLYKGLIHHLPAKLVPISQAPHQELRPAYHKRCGCQKLSQRVCGVNRLELGRERVDQGKWQCSTQTLLLPVYWGKAVAMIFAILLITKVFFINQHIEAQSI